MNELKTAAAAASRGARRARLKSRYAALLIASYLSRTSGKTFLAEAPCCRAQIDESGRQAADAGIPLSVAISSATVSSEPWQEPKAHESQIALLDRR